MDSFLIEVSSEAGRKVGGIYTVIESKSRYISQHFNGRYLFVGFYDERCAHDVKFDKPPKEVQAIFTQLSQMGIFCHYGKWIDGSNNPIILVDARHFGERYIQYEDDGQKKHDFEANYIKFMLWKHFGIDSLMESSYDFNENIVWGWAVGILLEKLSKIEPYASHRLIGQFHEWICGAALLYCRMQNLPIATVFTTHATVLGRALSSGGEDVLAMAQSSSQPIELSESYRVKVEGKHQLEMAAAKKCHVFTTVSETVAQEVRYMLGRYPDVITLNGMDFEKEQAEAQLRDLSEYVRSELLQLCESCFAPYYAARYDNALLVFISGRYEFENKGFDIFVKALGKLNDKIKEKGAKKSKIVIGFIFAPSSIRGPRISVIKNYLLLDKVNEVLGASPFANKKKHYPNVPSMISDVKSSLQRDLQTMYSGLIKEGDSPPISLFDLNYQNDAILNACAASGLTNAKNDPVKALFYPTYLRPNDGLLNMGYYDIISGMDVGIFPSRYEPFGYTPLEAGLKFNVAVSTDSAGFGRYLSKKENLEGRGVKILKLGAGTDHSAEELAQFLEVLYYCEPEELEKKKEDSYKLMHLFDWKLLVSNYLKAYDLALERASAESHGGGGIASETKQPLIESSKRIRLAAKSGRTNNAKAEKPKQLKKSSGKKK